MMRVLRLSGQTIALAALAVYRAAISPIIVVAMGPACRFQPTCSKYASEAVARHGAMRGSWLALRRILRCRPGGGWGYDPVVDRCAVIGEKREMLG
jgi:putative membrane protein insertion efficiency factor